MFQNETLFHILQSLQKMRVESPFFEKSSVSFILKRARGLGILTFGKIKKKALQYKIKKQESKPLKLSTFCQNELSIQKTMSKNFLWSLNSIANKTPYTFACSEIIPTETGKNIDSYTMK